MAKLKRVSDGRGDEGALSQAIRWYAGGKKKGQFKKVVSDRPTVGCSMLVGSVTARSFSTQDYWLTTVVLEIIEDRGDYVRFRTENSEYEWWR
jgi:hypothetical protein